jgi:hypothetical protein
LTSRKRCDLVLSPKGQPIRRDNAEPNLFDPPDMLPPSAGIWLEVKTAFQFREGGVRNSGYGNQWRDGVVEDLRKMAEEPMILEAGLVLIVFTDLESFENVLIQKEVLAGYRQVRTIKIPDRIGHRIGAVAIWPTVQR